MIYTVASTDTYIIAANEMASCANSKSEERALNVTLHCHFQNHSDETAHNGRAAFI